jgi:hypothetical protein
MDVVLASIENEQLVITSSEVTLVADMLLDDAANFKYDLIVLPVSWRFSFCFLFLFIYYLIVGGMGDLATGLFYLFINNCFSITTFCIFFFVGWIYVVLQHFWIPKN